MPGPGAAGASSPFPLEEQEQTQSAAIGGSWNPWQGPSKPSFFSGMGPSEDTAYLGPIYRTLEAAGNGAAKGEALLAGVAHGFNAFAAERLGNVPVVGPMMKYEEQQSAALEQDAAQRVKALTPDPSTTGTAVQMLNGIVSGAYRMTVGSLAGGPLGGAALLGGSEAVNRYNDLTAQGVNAGTAAESAGVTGVLQGAGALFPGGWGAGLVKRIATGVAGNVGLGIASRFADHAVLEHGGYTDMANQQKVMDGSQVIADAVLGAGFGYLSHLHAGAEASALAQRQKLLDAIGPLGQSAGAEDAARTVELAAADRRASPGVPTDPASQAAHQSALQSATTSLLRGESVDVSDSGIENAQMLARPEEPQEDLGRQVIAQAFRNAGVQGAEQRLADLEAGLTARLRGEPVQAPAQEPITENVKEGAAQPAPAPGQIPLTEIPRAEEGSLSSDDRSIETRFAMQLAGDYEGMKARYAALPDSNGGKILNTDTARELSPDYLADRTKSAAVHEPASWFVKRLYAEKLAQPPGPGEDPLVLFTGGGTGAGKSTAVRDALGPLAQRAQIVFDTNMNGEESSIEKIDQATAAGKKVVIAYVHRDPVESLVQGALTRAMRQEREHGSGRTVPIEKHVNTHVGANEAIRHIAAHYEADPRVAVHIIDNTGGPGGSKLIELEKLPRLDYNKTREEASTALEAAHTQGRISPAVYRGFRGEHPVEHAGTPAEEQGAGAGARGQLEPQRAEQRPDQLTDERDQAEVAPGTPFLAFRASSEPSAELANRNAANADSVGSFLQRLEEPEGAVPAGRVGKEPKVINVYRVEHQGGFEPYAAFNQGKAGREGQYQTHGRVGREFRQREGGGIVYSFPEGGKYRSEHLGSVPIAELRQALKERGYGNFDEAGSRETANALRELVQKRFTSPEQAGAHTVMTATGRRIAVAPKVMELRDLVTSDHPEYPQELQPRQRGARAALTEQVRGIARNLNPELLGNAPEADRGAPITGPGNVVESGNGRAFALREVYADHPEKAAQYRAYLQKLGYNVAGMKEPVLVRRRLTQLQGDERRAFTVEVNQTSVAALSPVERAQADARLLDGGVLSQLRSGDLATAQNAPFVRSFLERLPEAERNELVNPDGTVSQAGVRRLQSAVLAKAYGGAPESNAVLGRMLESTDNDMRSTMGAMLDAAPAFAKLRQAIEDGKISKEYDLSKALTQAVETVAQVREKGQALGEFLKQEDMLTRRPAVVDALMKALYDRKGERIGARDKVARTLMNYADRAISQRLDQGMLFGDAPVPPERLLASDESVKEEVGEPQPGADMFGLRTPQGKTPARGAAAVAAQALERNPNLEMPDETGEPQRARAELMAAEQGVSDAEARAKVATDAAANCFGQRAA